MHGACTAFITSSAPGGNRPMPILTPRRLALRLQGYSWIAAKRGFRPESPTAEQRRLRASLITWEGIQVAQGSTERRLRRTDHQCAGTPTNALGSRRPWQANDEDGAPENRGHKTGWPHHNGVHRHSSGVRGHLCPNGVNATHSDRQNTSPNQASQHFRFHCSSPHSLPTLIRVEGLVKRETCRLPSRVT